MRPLPVTLSRRLIAYAAVTVGDEALIPIRTEGGDVKDKEKLKWPGRTSRSAAAASSQAWVAPDGAMVVRTDTNGAYLWNGSRGCNRHRIEHARGVRFQRPRRLRNPNRRQQYQHHLHAHTTVTSSRAPTREQLGRRRPFPASADSGGSTANDSYRHGRPEDGHRSQQSQYRLCRHTETAGCMSRPMAVLLEKVAQYPWAVGRHHRHPVRSSHRRRGQRGDADHFASSYGNGVYESTNGGSTWTRTPAARPTSIRRRLDHGRLLCSRTARASGATPAANGRKSRQPSDPVGGGRSLESERGRGRNSRRRHRHKLQRRRDLDRHNVFQQPGTPPTFLGCRRQHLEGRAGNFIDVGGAAFNPPVANQIIVSGGTGVWTTPRCRPRAATSSTPET